MPFPPPQHAYSKHRDLRRYSSYKEGELSNLYFDLAENASNRNDIQVKKTKGFTRFNVNAGATPGAKAGLGLGGFQPSVGNYTYVYAAWDNATPDTQIYSMRSASAEAYSEGATARFVTNGNTVEFEQTNDVLYITNGVDAVIKRVAAGTWSALAVGEPLSGASTVAKYLSWHNFMMFACNTITAPNKLNVSDAGDPEAYSGNTKTFRHTIVGLKPMGDYQVVYTERSIHLISGFEPNLLSFREIENPHPCVSHRSIVQYKGNKSGEPTHIYLGADYVWAFNGASFEILGHESWDEIREDLNTARLDQAAAYYDTEAKQYRISVCTGANTANDTTYAYDFISGRWIKLPYRSAVAYTKLGSPKPETYWQDANDTGIVTLENDGTGLELPFTLIDDVANITADATTITVDSTADFPSTGVIVIEGESIWYETKTGGASTEFGGCVRGYSGTEAATHADNKEVNIAPKFKYTTISMGDGEKNLFKKYKFGWLDAKSTSGDTYSINVSFSTDRGGYQLSKSIPLQVTGGTWGTDVWGAFLWGSLPEVPYPDQRYVLSGNARELKLTFEENSNLDQTELYSFEYKYRILRKK